MTNMFFIFIRQLLQMFTVFRGRLPYCLGMHPEFILAEKFDFVTFRARLLVFWGKHEFKGRDTSSELLNIESEGREQPFNVTSESKCHSFL